mmetsp:Transcript_42325/g.83369  ORF Transcript_42325/g.83369 Transcript_42325/m.83369 type:complete len:271 (+) Transcript_42325:127-939(+)
MYSGNTSRSSFVVLSFICCLWRHGPLLLNFQIRSHSASPSLRTSSWVDFDWNIGGFCSCLGGRFSWGSSQMPVLLLLALLRLLLLCRPCSRRRGGRVLVLLASVLMLLVVPLWLVVPSIAPVLLLLLLLLILLMADRLLRQLYTRLLYPAISSSKPLLCLVVCECRDTASGGICCIQLQKLVFSSEVDGVLSQIHIAVPCLYSRPSPAVGLYGLFFGFVNAQEVLLAAVRDLRDPLPRLVAVNPFAHARWLPAECHGWDSPSWTPAPLLL